MKMKHDPKVRNMLLDKENDDSYLSSAQDAYALLFRGDDAQELLGDCFNAIKHTTEWSDLADYYLALRYLWDVWGNDAGMEYNMMIGAELMKAFAYVSNPYAAFFLEFNMESVINAESSQNVDDK